MRFSHKALGFVVNFLLGVAWGAVLLGTLSSFFSFYHQSFPLAIVSAVIGALPGLFFVLLLEYFITEKEKLDELKKQTAILEKLLEEKNS